MNIEEFSRQYGKGENQSIDELVQRWLAERKLDELLGMPIVGGVLVGDYLVGRGIADIDWVELKERIPDSVQSAFGDLMGEKADSIEEIRKLILEKYQNSEASLNGLINKIQGQVGENQFMSVVGDRASLAESASQEGWDVAVKTADGFRYVQVKVYADPNGVLAEIREVNKKIADGELYANDGITHVSEVEFAVNSDIVDEVRAKAEAAGLSNPILDIGATRADIRVGLVESSHELIHPPFENFFGDLLGNTLTAAALHATVNGFLYWRGAKDRTTAASDTVYSAGISSGGLAAAGGIANILTTPLELALGTAGGPIGAGLAISVGIITRGALSRLADRRFVVDRLLKGNKLLSEACSQLHSTGKSRSSDVDAVSL